MLITTRVILQIFFMVMLTIINRFGKWLILILTCAPDVTCPQLSTIVSMVSKTRKFLLIPLVLIGC